MTVESYPVSGHLVYLAKQWQLFCPQNCIWHWGGAWEQILADAMSKKWVKSRALASISLSSTHIQNKNKFNHNSIIAQRALDENGAE